MYRARDRLGGGWVALKRVRLPAATQLGTSRAPALPVVTLHDDPAHSLPEPAAAGPATAVTGFTEEATMVAALELAAWSNDTIGPSSHDPLGLALGREFRTLASLRHPNIISVFDYGFEEQQQPFYTMELLTDAQPLLAISRTRDLPGRVGLLLQVLQALSYLHRRGVLHRDLKPANVLVQGERVVVLDFGLATLRSVVQRRSAVLSGTLHYMAPELLLGEPPSEASDLYAFGVMAVQVLTGQRPFEAEHSELLVSRMLSGELVLPNVALPEPLRLILERLLSREPAVRPQDAGQTAIALAQAVGLPFAHESAQLRESYLQAAEFIGRESELKTLRGVLQQTLRGHGGVWLIGGESGVGKSRLLDELRTLALVRGAHVDRGQAVSEAGSPYQIFLDTLRSIALSVPLSPLEASTLKAILPELPTLLQHPIADPPTVEAQVARARLQSLVCDLLHRRSEPTVLILEDLHWASPDSIEILSRLLPDAERYPLLILASYRDDEKPHLPEELPGTKLMQLQRLSQRSIVSLIESMLGQHNVRPDLLAWLRDQTEGNPFFLVEILRTLADEAGSLQRVGSVGAHDLGLRGGLATLVERRLARLPAWTLPALRFAAIRGRRIDLPLQRARLAADTQEAEVPVLLTRWLTACADAAVLELSNEHWQFSHDKLREGILASLSATETRRLHREVAQKLQASRTVTADVAAALAFHLQQAGDAVGAFHFALLAAQGALSRGALAEAEELLRTALRSEAAGAPPLIERVRARRLLGAVQLARGELSDCMQTTEEGLLLFGLRLPSAQHEVARGLLQVLWTQGQLRLREIFPRLSVPSLPAALQSREALDEAYGLFATHGEGALYLCAEVRLLYCALCCVNLADHTGDAAQRLFSYSAMSYSASVVPLPSVSALYLRRAHSLRQSLPNTHAEYEFLRLRCATYINETRFAEALKDSEQAARVARHLGSEKGILFTTQQRLWIGYMRDDLVSERSRVEEFLDLAQRARHEQFIAWGQAHAGTLALASGQAERAYTLLSQALVGGRQVHDLFCEMHALCVRAVAQLARHDWESARGDADAALGLYEATPLVAYGLVPALNHLVDACFALVAEAPPVIRAAQGARLARALRFQARIARRLLVAQPGALRSQARLCRQRGQEQRAAELIRQADALIADWRAASS
mgnify:CR=1 FL=1